MGCHLQDQVTHRIGGRCLVGLLGLALSGAPSEESRVVTEGSLQPTAGEEASQ